MARDLRLFYLFRLLATTYLWVPVFVIFMASRGLDFVDVMLLSALYSVVVIVVEVPTGAFADRIGRRTSMMVGALAMVASCLIAYSAHSFAVFAIAEVFAALSMSLCSGADSAYLFDLLQSNGRGHEYARREGTSSAWHHAGSAIAFGCGGLLAKHDLALPHLVTAGVSALAFLVALFMGGEPERKRSSQSLGEELGEYMTHMGQALREVRHSGRLIWAIVYSSVIFTLLRATIYLYQPFLQSRDFGMVATGLTFAGVYVVATFVAHHFDGIRRWLGEGALIWALPATLGSTFLVMLYVPGKWVLGLLFVQAVASGLYSPLTKVLINRQILQAARRATILSVESIAKRAAMGVFSPVAGVLGASSAVLLCGGVGILGLCGLAAFARHAPVEREGGSVKVAGGALVVAEAPETTAPISDV